MKSMSTIATGANPKEFLLKTLRQIRRATYISTRMLGDVNAIASGVSRTINRWVKNRLIPGGSALTTFSLEQSGGGCRSVPQGRGARLRRGTIADPEVRCHWRRSPLLAASDPLMLSGRDEARELVRAESGLAEEIDELSF